MAEIMNSLTVKALYHYPEHTLAWDYLNGFTYPWEALDGLKQLILDLGRSLPKDRYDEISEGVWVAKTATVAPTAFIGAPAIIGENTEVRQCAFVRGSALVGNGCVAALWAMALPIPSSRLCWSPASKS